MKHIYVDFDGVINKVKMNQNNFMIDDELVRNLCWLIRKYELTLIMTSSWRFGFLGPGNPDNTPQVRELEASLGRYGVTIKDKIPMTHEHSRDEQIKYYESRHPSDDYVIIDDDKNEFREITDHCYFTDPSKGFSSDDAYKVSELLGKKG